MLLSDNAKRELMTWALTALPILGTVFLISGSIGARVFFFKFNIDSNFILDVDDLIYVTTAGVFELCVALAVMFLFFFVYFGFLSYIIFSIWMQFSKDKMGSWKRKLQGSQTISFILVEIALLVDLLTFRKIEVFSPQSPIFTGHILAAIKMLSNVPVIGETNFLFLRSLKDISVYAQAVPQIILLVVLGTITLVGWIGTVASRAGKNSNIVSIYVVLVSAAFLMASPAAGAYFHLSNPNWARKQNLRTEKCDEAAPRSEANVSAEKNSSAAEILASAKPENAVTVVSLVVPNDTQGHIKNAYKQDASTTAKARAEVIWSGPKAVLLICHWDSDPERTKKLVIMNPESLVLEMVEKERELK